MATTTPYQKVFLIVLDGFGLADRGPGNAILAAGMPYLNSLVARYPAMALTASGLAVGLPWGQSGNSEVGHSALGTGRVAVQDLAHINAEIRSGDFFKNPALLAAIAHVKRHDSALHLMGCASPGGIHAHTDHLIALLELAHQHSIEKVFVHFIADGEDMPPQDALNVLQTIAPALKKSGGRIASVQGRAYAMDRVLNWKLTERVWHAVVLGDAPPITDVAAYIKEGYAREITDYALEPATVVEQGNPIGPVRDNDAMIFFDFRRDRARQMAMPFAFASSFNEFDLVRRPQNLTVVTMTSYSDAFTVPVAYPSPNLPQTLGEVISVAGYGQWRITEQEKEAHVTSFFNGGKIQAFEGEQRAIVPSRHLRGTQYLEHPELSARQIVEAVVKTSTDDARLWVINFANADMIAHVGDLGVTVRALAILDACVRQIVEHVLRSPEHAIVITSDHGNAEELIDPLTGGPDTQHSTRTVPAIFVAAGLEAPVATEKSLESLAQEAPAGTLIDIAPSILALLGIAVPPEMTGSVLYHSDRIVL